MNNTVIALKKILTTMLHEKYPMIADIRVVEYSDTDLWVYLGTTYTDLYGKANDTALENEIRKYVKKLSKYVTGNKNEIIIYFFDPDQV